VVENVARRLRESLRRQSPVERYWTRHTVNSTRFETTKASLEQLEWRFEQYPLFREFMDLWGNHADETILDYGCGPGNDMVGFLLFSGARRVVGADVSRRALDLAADRLRLHSVDQKRYALIKLSESSVALPLEAGSVDYLHCAGVLQHTTDPELILHEQHRVLRDGAKGCVMVYNRDSIWFHLYTAYTQMVVNRAFPDLTVEEAFARNTDGPKCPIARCYRCDDFVAMCHRAGFEAEYVGGYLASFELDQLREFGEDARRDPRLAEEHRQFLEELTYDDGGFPFFRGRSAGIGGVYRLTKR
jgi:ubiquinone/menaquinone biosynthesis C-methylase UbiE